MAIHLHTLVSANHAQTEPENPKYKRLAERQSEIVAKYHESDDKIKYLRTIAHYFKMRVFRHTMA